MVKGPSFESSNLSWGTSYSVTNKKKEKQNETIL
jgi:hypothetical protein